MEWDGVGWGGVSGVGWSYNNTRHRAFRHRRECLIELHILQVGRPQSNWIGNSIGNSIGRPLGNAIGDAIGNARGNATGNSIGNAIGNALDNSIRNSLAN